VCVNVNCLKNTVILMTKKAIILPCILGTVQNEMKISLRPAYLMKLLYGTVVYI